MISSEAIGSVPDFSTLGGEMGARIEEMDWSKSPLGPIADWSPTLRTMVSMLLANRFPLLLWWGPEYISIYNDAYRPVLGEKHPWALGKPVRECWSEIWQVLKPLIDTPYRGGPATWMEDLHVEINRHGFLEETHFTVAYSPVPDDAAAGGIGGVLATVHEITEKIVGERRLAILRGLGARAGEARTADEACAIAADVLSTHGKDVPFVFLYLLERGDTCARLAGAAGAVAGDMAAPQSLDVGAEGCIWPFAEVLRTECTVEVDDLASRLAKVPAGPWPDPPQCAAVVPVRSNVAHHLAGFLVAGVSPRLRVDERYRSFLDLVAAQIATAVASAREYEEERRRAQALAEIDRAKTAFFSNVSHEFRTPLTLMLGPLDEALASRGLPAAERPRIELAHRNALRLLRLVNSLLDYSRVEADRAALSCRAIDLSELTADLASNFRSACERARLVLVVDCPPLPEPVFVDPDMWEKIVLNLLSNAFKFTFQGEIVVALRAEGGCAEMVVRDTGIGIADSELPRIFERFHRIENAGGRTHEGTGIGLALARELVKMQGGNIGVASTLGKGTTFTIRMPFGTAHLPPRSIDAQHGPSTRTRAEAYVAEALRWLPDEAENVHDDAFPDRTAHSADGASRLRVLIADDNADMRNHLRGILGAHYVVDSVADGETALGAIISTRPDLVVADVMMPRLDGLSLLGKIRSRPDIADIPVVLLSARAGDDSRIEGLGSGADDYLVKPFGARELLARVDAALKLAHLRRQTAESLRASEASLAAELATTRQLQEIGNALVRNGDVEMLYDRIVEAAAFLMNSDAASMQTLHPDSGELKLLASKGFHPTSAAYWQTVRKASGSLCAAAVSAGERLIARDVEACDFVSGRRDLEEYRRSRIRSAQSTPLVSRSGRLLGMISTHWREPHEPSANDLRRLDLLARQAADLIERAQAEEMLRESEERLRLATEAADVGLWDVDPVNGTLFWPPVVKSMFGISADVPVTMADFYAGIHSDDRERTTAALAAALDPEKRALYDVEYRTIGKEDRIVRWVAAKGRGVFDARGTCVRVIGTAVDITARKGFEQHRSLLIDELNHRVKNTLATVQSFASQTLRNASSPAQARAMFEQRLVALAKTHDVLTREHWAGADLKEVVSEAVAAYAQGRDARRFSLNGPDLRLRPKAALALSMALHELSTNAVKYGSLSTGTGVVEIDWQMSPGERAQFRLRWTEGGGPPVTTPHRRGFGSRLVEQGLAQDLAGRARLEFRREGLRCVIEAPLDEICTKDEDGLRTGTSGRWEAMEIGL